MTNFEKVTASPEVLAEMLEGLNVADGPWTEAFHRAYCDGCGAENCDAENCPHNDLRDNPAWWLGLEDGRREDSKENRWRKAQTAALLWTAVVSTIAIVLSLIKLLR